MLKAEPLAAEGVHVVDTPAQAVAGTDVVLTMLYDGPAALETMREAARPPAPAGTAWVQSTTGRTRGHRPIWPAFAPQSTAWSSTTRPSWAPRQPAEAGPADRARRRARRRAGAG